MNDLFGNPVPDTPAMTDPVPFVAWEFLGEYGDVMEIWAAQTEQQARDAYSSTVGCAWPHEVAEIVEGAWLPIARRVNATCCLWTRDAGDIA